MLNGNDTLKNQDKIIDILEEYIHEQKTLDEVFKTLQKSDLLSILNQLDPTHQHRLRQILIKEINSWHVFSANTAWHNSFRTVLFATGFTSLAILLSAPIAIPTLLVVGASIDIANTQSVHRNIIDERAVVLLKMLDANFSKLNSYPSAPTTSGLYPFSIFNRNSTVYSNEPTPPNANVENKVTP